MKYSVACNLMITIYLMQKIYLVDRKVRQHFVARLNSLTFICIEIRLLVLNILKLFESRKYIQSKCARFKCWTRLKTKYSKKKIKVKKIEHVTLLFKLKFLYSRALNYLMAVKWQTIQKTALRLTTINWICM